MPEKKKKRDTEGGTMPLKRIGVCSVIGAALFFLELIAFSAAELKMAFGNGFYLPAGLATAFVSAFVADTDSAMAGATIQAGSPAWASGRLISARAE
jgi:hypothetical protein